MLKLCDVYIDVKKVSYIGAIDKSYIPGGFDVVVNGVELTFQYGNNLEKTEEIRDLLISACCNEAFVADKE